jgi:hypothetical protein
MPELKKLAVTVLGPAWEVELVDEADLISPEGIRHLHVIAKTKGPGGKTGELNVIQESLQAPQESVANPFGIPWWQIGAGAAILGAGGWALWRVTQRNALAKMLDTATLVAAAREQGLIDWTSSEKAAEVIGWFSFTSAPHGFLTVMEELRALLPPDSVSSTSVARDLALALGAEALYSKLPDVPGVDTTSLFNWAMGKG